MNDAELRPLTLGILTSGGDCAGLNSVIVGVAQGAARRGWRLIGIEDGTLGLMERPLRARELRVDGLDGQIFRRGGSFLGTVSRGDPFRFPLPDGGYADRSGDFVAGVRELGLEALVVIGGDGSMRILARLCAQARLPMIGIPKTIDNDVPGTEATIGFASAVQVVSDALDDLQTTAASHRRAIVVEVMGREAGHIALHGGIAGGADAIVLPEFGVDLPAVAARVRERFARGSRYALVVVAEGVEPAGGDARRAGEGVGDWLGRQIERDSGIETRCTTLGHLQRGGAPCARDRVLASAFAAHAVELIAARRFDRVVVWRQARAGDEPLAAATRPPARVDAAHPLLDVARRLGIELGAAPQAGGRARAGPAAPRRSPRPGPAARRAPPDRRRRRSSCGRHSSAG